MYLDPRPVPVLNPRLNSEMWQILTVVCSFLIIVQNCDIPAENIHISNVRKCFVFIGLAEELEKEQKGAGHDCKTYERQQH